TCTATMPVGVGQRTNIAEVTANPEISPDDQVSDTDDAVVVVPKPTPTPTRSVEALTPPPTSTLDAAAAQTPAGSGLLLVVRPIAGILLTAGAMNPATRRASRRRNR